MLTTKDTVLWCREHRFTPQKSDPSTLVAEEITTLGYCKFCGCNRASDHQGNMDECPRRPKAWSTRKRYAGINSITSVTGLLTKLEPGWDEEKETDDMDIDVDVNAAESSKASASTSRSSVHQQMIDRIRDWKLTQHMDVANERTLDWIWSVVGQLQLKGMIANDMAVTRDGQVQRLVSGLDLQAAMEQRLVVAIHKNEELDFLTNQYLGPEKKDLTDEEMDPHETTCTK
ncbi:uncharacterized protein BYT42DRAFT_594493 [Radiomyces spectabilis]|uniref:uncharacterized protein n=1 Tax=Radiomyces spectabilis TaxID=64574 RepID=UPI00221E682D|nr:uncharacterized protein BYT42DRAFT_594493 [Radiomyces spectabilis]KAI8374352.1 hypothetical protein BYT42DRAFT_594493 [Radiomyces spectabilis]